MDGDDFKNKLTPSALLFDRGLVPTVINFCLVCASGKYVIRNLEDAKSNSRLKTRARRVCLEMDFGPTVLFLKG